MNWHTLDLTISGAVATVTLNRPRVHNAFNETSIKELEHSFRMFGDRREVRAIVLRGSVPSTSPWTNSRPLIRSADRR